MRKHSLLMKCGVSESIQPCCLKSNGKGSIRSETELFYENKLGRVEPKVLGSKVFI